MAVDAFVKAGALAEALAIANISFFTGTKVRSGCVETSGIGVTVVLTERAFVHVGALRVRPAPRL